MDNAESPSNVDAEPETQGAAPSASASASSAAEVGDAAPSQPQRPHEDAPIIEDGAIRGASPADGTALLPVPVTDIDTLRDVVARCRVAQARHGARSVEDRATLLRRFADALLRRGEDTVRVLMNECGKLEQEARLVAKDIGRYPLWAGDKSARRGPRPRKAHVWAHARDPGAGETCADRIDGHEVIAARHALTEGAFGISPFFRRVAKGR